MNTLYYGDNLKVLREYIKDETVDLIYLDPPFNSSRNYNVLFKDESGKDSEAQITAFEDTWHWTEAAKETFDDLVINGAEAVSKAILALFNLIGTNQMAAYLVMMTARLVELHRVLKPTGSLYLHCDPTASHYLKVVLDAVFGPENFRNEIVWERTSSHNDSRKWAAVHDVIFYYARSKAALWNPVYTAHSEDYVQAFYTHHDERGVYRLDHVIRSASMGPRPNLTYAYKGYTPDWGWRVLRKKLEALDADGRLEWSKSGRPYLKRYLSEQKGTPIKSVISDIPPISARAAERLGYPTQKPLALLERIIQASSNEGDVVLDPFCGCGTAIDAAQGLGRQWIGIDITSLSTALIKNRLEDRFPKIKRGIDYKVVGEPVDVAGAQALFKQDPFQFQWWALGLVRAKPWGGTGGKEGKKGSDGGIDGIITFAEGGANKFQRVIVQVKGGGVQPRDIQQLESVVSMQNAPIGLFITLQPPTEKMKKVAVEAGKYHAPGWHEDYPRIQILTIEDLLSGKAPQIPGAIKFNPAARAVDDSGKDKQGKPVL